MSGKYFEQIYRENQNFDFNSGLFEDQVKIDLKKRNFLKRWCISESDTFFLSSIFEIYIYSSSLSATNQK